MADEPNPDLIEKTARTIFEAQVFRPSWGARPSWDSEAMNQDSFRTAAHALADAGLLADPEQHAELGLLRMERHVLTTERDALSLMLRAMARKLCAYRRWADGEVPTVHRLRTEVAELRERLDAQNRLRAKAMAMLRKKQVDLLATRAERDALQARIDDVLGWLQNADGMELTRVGIAALQEKLRGDQPTGEADRG